MKKSLTLFTMLITLFVFSAISISNEKPAQISKIATQDVTIKDVQFLPDSLLLADADDSPLFGDTVTVEGIAMFPVRKIYVGNRWSLFITTEEGGPWSCLQIIQDDTFATATNFSALEAGDKVKFTGIVDEYRANERSATQVRLLTNPVVSIEFVSFANPLPEAVELTCEDLNSVLTGEYYESALVTIKNATVVGGFGDYLQINDGTGEVLLNAHFNALYRALNEEGYTYPDIGAKIDVYGYVRDYRGYFYLCPPTPDAITVKTEPPIISDVVRNPSWVKSTDAVQVQAKIKDPNGTVSATKIFYSINYAEFQETALSAVDDSTFNGTIPPAADGDLVRFFLWAEDNDAETSTAPADTASELLFYTVRDEGLTIYDLQWSPYASGNSPYDGFEVTVTGVAVTDSTHFRSDYVLQDETGAWRGIWVHDADHKWNLGDKVTVTGTAQERYNLTQITDVTHAELVSQGNPVEPTVVNTGMLRTGSADAESYESVFVEVRDIVVANPFADSPYNYGEFTVDDGTGDVRVAALATSFGGNRDSSYALNDSLELVRGILYYSYYNFKIEPRNMDDVVRKTTAAVENEFHQPLAFELKQNYPNPFNPATSIRYQLGAAENVQIIIYNLQGQRIKTLVNSFQTAGNHTIEWDGTTDVNLQVASGVYFAKLVAGDFHSIKKMLLVR